MHPEKAKYWLAKDGCPRQLREYVELANMFGDYMDRNLIQGGDAVHNSLGMQLPSLLYFRRNDNQVTMVLSDGTVQVGIGWLLLLLNWGDFLDRVGRLIVAIFSVKYF